MINFKLRELDKIVPWGEGKELSLHWFALTDGDLWLTFGCNTIYEYSQEALLEFEGKESQYNDYYIVRFLEDFSHLFEKISESIPERFYNRTENIKLFKDNAQKWLDIYETDEDEYSDFYFDEYDKLISWTTERSFDSGHLIGGPYLYFFRHNGKIRIVWETECILENGVSVWTANDGSLEMNYTDFVSEVKSFGEAFFIAMDKQIDLAIEKNWTEVKLDKIRLLEEHKERKLEFEKKLSFLDQNMEDGQNWEATEDLYKRMQREIK
ncbi:DUF5984 family protein [Flavobacterium ardleyense]|uniref:DUF5984 family protein n=1 Tax=Flavobacterium ardleyense TaxID=2038737 RepID=A0ABW5Z2Q3_9FLAO